VDDLIDFIARKIKEEEELIMQGGHKDLKPPVMPDVVPEIKFKDHINNINNMNKLKEAKEREKRESERKKLREIDELVTSKSFREKIDYKEK